MYSTAIGGLFIFLISRLGLQTHSDSSASSPIRADATDQLNQREPRIQSARPTGRATTTRRKPILIQQRHAATPATWRPCPHIWQRAVQPPPITEPHARPVTVHTVPDTTDTTKDSNHEAPARWQATSTVPHTFSLFDNPLPQYNYLRALEIKRPCSRSRATGRANVGRAPCT